MFTGLLTQAGHEFMHGDPLFWIFDSSPAVTIADDDEGGRREFR